METQTVKKGKEGDAVTERLEADLKLKNIAFKNQEIRLEKVMGSVVSANMKIRPSFSAEASRRKLELEGMQRVLRQAEAVLKDAFSDYARRELERTKGFTLAEKIEVAEKKINDVMLELNTLEQERDSLVAQANECKRLASDTKTHLEILAKAEKESLQKVFDEETRNIEFTIRSVKKALEKAKAAGNDLRVEEFHREIQGLQDRASARHIGE